MTIRVTPEELSQPVDATAYRVIQESLTNVIRHAKATRAHVEADIRDGSLHLSIADDGLGVPVSGTAMPATAHGHGLAGMTERVRLLGGSLSAGSAGGGFTVEATIPARLER